jgi:hypothetical protein
MELLMLFLEIPNQFERNSIEIKNKFTIRKYHNAIDQLPE